MANHAAQNGEKISNASAAAAERFRKKEMNSKKKKKIVVEPREQVSKLFSRGTRFGHRKILQSWISQGDR